VQGDTEG